MYSLTKVRIYLAQQKKTGIHRRISGQYSIWNDIIDLLLCRSYEPLLTTQESSRFVNVRQRIFQPDYISSAFMIGASCSC